MGNIVILPVTRRQPSIDEINRALAMDEAYAQFLARIDQQILADLATAA